MKLGRSKGPIMAIAGSRQAAPRTCILLLCVSTSSIAQLILQGICKRLERLAIHKQLQLEGLRHARLERYNPLLPMSAMVRRASMQCCRYRKESSTGTFTTIGRKTQLAPPPKDPETRMSEDTACMRRHLLACGWPKEELQGNMADAAPRVRTLSPADRRMQRCTAGACGVEGSSPGGQATAEHDYACTADSQSEIHGMPAPSPPPALIPPGSPSLMKSQLIPGCDIQQYQYTNMSCWQGDCTIIDRPDADSWCSNAHQEFLKTLMQHSHLNGLRVSACQYS